MYLLLILFPKHNYFLLDSITTIIMHNVVSLTDSAA